MDTDVEMFCPSDDFWQALVLRPEHFVQLSAWVTCMAPDLHRPGMKGSRVTDPLQLCDMHNLGDTHV